MIFTKNNTVFKSSLRDVTAWGLVFLQNSKNVLYKVISGVVANHTNPILIRNSSSEMTTPSQVQILINNGYRISWILWQEKNCRQFRLLKWASFYLSVRSSSRRRGNGIKGVDGEYRYFSKLGVSLFRAHGNLV